MNDPGDARVLLGAGSNVGDRLGWLRQARRALDAAQGVRVAAASDVYETDPVGGPPQGAFLNACLVVATALAPHGLLDVLHAIEAGAGRVRGARNEPRTLDLDVLAWGESAIRDARIEVPHPRLRERAFALRPAADVAGGWRIPPSHDTIEALLRRVPGGGVRRYCGAEDWR